MDDNIATKNSKNFTQRQLRPAISATGSSRFGILQQADSELINLRGQREIFFSQSPGTVGGKCEGDLVPPDVNIGMVIGFLGEECNGIHKSH